MADTSRQVKEGGRYGVPAQRDLAAALAGLSEEDLLRLRAIARLRARSLPGDMSWSDLLQEAMPRALTGARPWPPGVSLLAFLAGVMRSIGDEQWRRHRRQSIMLHELRPDYARATTLPSQSTPMVIASKPTVSLGGLRGGLPLICYGPREGRKVCRLAAGAEWIRTSSTRARSI